MTLLNKKKIIDLLGQRKRILITGGSGVIGGAVVRRLIKNTDAFIFNLDKFSYSSDHYSIDQTIKQSKNKSIERYKFIQVNLFNKEETINAIKVANPDLIMHLAAESHVDRSIDSPQEFVSSNIVGTFNLLQASRRHFDSLNIERKEYFRFHHISTDEVFGSLGENGLFSEKTSYDPRSPYSASKAASDHLVNAWHHTYGLPIVLTNCSNNYGPWQFPEKLIPITIIKILNGEKIPIYGDGLNRRDWLYVEDHVDALLLAANKGKLGSKYCIGGSNEIDNRSLVEMICKLLKKKLNSQDDFLRLISFVKDRPGHDRRYSIDSSLIQKELSWAPFTKLEKGLELTIDWYLKNINWCKEMQKRSSYSGERLGIL